MRASSPLSAARRTSRIRSTRPLRSPKGAAKSLRKYAADQAGQLVEEVGDIRGDLGIGGEQSVILVALGGEDVVVAGAEMDVAAEVSPSRRTTSVILRGSRRFGNP